MEADDATHGNLGNSGDTSPDINPLHDGEALPSFRPIYWKKPLSDLFFMVLCCGIVGEVERFLCCRLTFICFGACIAYCIYKISTGTGACLITMGQEIFFFCLNRRLFGWKISVSDASLLESITELSEAFVWELSENFRAYSFVKYYGAVATFDVTVVGVNGEQMQLEALIGWLRVAEWSRLRADTFYSSEGTLCWIVLSVWPKMFLDSSSRRQVVYNACSRCWKENFFARRQL